MHKQSNQSSREKEEEGGENLTHWHNTIVACWKNNLKKPGLIQKMEENKKMIVKKTVYSTKQEERTLKKKLRKEKYQPFIID